MSRRPEGAAHREAIAYGVLSRRQLMQGSLVLATGVHITAEGDPAVGVCKRWLASDAEHEMLTRRWQYLEHRLFQRYAPPYSDQRFKGAPEFVEMNAIDRRLDDLCESKAELFAAVLSTPAATLSGLLLKLTVAEASIQPDEDEAAHKLIQSTLNDGRKIAGMRV